PSSAIIGRVVIGSSSGRPICKQMFQSPSPSVAKKLAPATDTVRYDVRRFCSRNQALTPLGLTVSSSPGHAQPFADQVLHSSLLTVRPSIIAHKEIAPSSHGRR